jgi:replication factor A2
VRNISTLSTHIIYKIDDGTGEIEVKHYVDLGDSMDVDESSPVSGKAKVEQNGYAKVFGKLVTVGSKRYIGTRFVRPVTNINEVHYHLLEATAIHLFFTRGPPAGAARGHDAGHTGNPGGIGSSAGDGYGASTHGRPLPPMSPLARRVYNLLKIEPQSNEGLHVQLIAAKLQLPITEAVKAADELVAGGLIFSTVDEHTWAILEY